MGRVAALDGKNPKVEVRRPGLDSVAAHEHVQVRRRNPKDEVVEDNPMVGDRKFEKREDDPPFVSQDSLRFT